MSFSPRPATSRVTCQPDLAKNIIWRQPRARWRRQGIDFVSFGHCFYNTGGNFVPSVTSDSEALLFLKVIYLGISFRNVKSHGTYFWNIKIKIKATAESTENVLINLITSDLSTKWLILC